MNYSAHANFASQKVLHILITFFIPISYWYGPYGNAAGVYEFTKEKKSEVSPGILDLPKNSMGNY